MALSNVTYAETRAAAPTEDFGSADATWQDVIDDIIALTPGQSAIVQVRRLFDVEYMLVEIRRSGIFTHTTVPNTAATPGIWAEFTRVE